MKNKKKKRLNLYLKGEAIDFAKEWSYVTKKPISKMLEEYLIHQKEMVSSITPFQWLSDPIINPAIDGDDVRQLNELDEYFSNSEEKEFCHQNPDHPRAKIRNKLMEEYKENCIKKMKLRKNQEKELIQRWMEMFNS